jgi:hypothetical protein
VTGQLQGQAVLALRREGDTAIFQRFFDRSTSGWRYRCTGTVDPASGTFTDFTQFRANNPKKVETALRQLDLLEEHLPEISIVSPASYSSEGLSEELATLLLYYADLFRFLRVNMLIVSRHFGEEQPVPVEFRRFTPPYNLIVALDFRQFARQAIERELPMLMETASAPTFRDDGYSNAAGTLRALADMLEREGATGETLAVLALSHKLAANPGKAARLVELLHAEGREDEARKTFSEATATWPEDRRLADAGRVLDRAH